MKNHGLTCNLKIDNKSKPIFQTSESNVIIKDEKGKTVHSQPFRSFTANYLRMLWGNALSKNVTTQGKDILGVDFAPNTKFFYLSDDAGIYNSGLCVGTGTADVAQEDYTLSFITDLTYYATSTGTKTSTSNSVKLPIERTIKNDTGAVKVINELGIVIDGVLIAREKLTTPVTLAAGASRDITINLVYSFDSVTGGFVESWCDLFNLASYTESISQTTTFNARRGFCFFQNNNKNYIIAGNETGTQEDAYVSTDLTNWTRYTTNIGFKRNGMAYCEHNSEFYVFGGYNGSAMTNTIFKSTDPETTFSQITTSGTIWGIREGACAFSWNGKLWIGGGENVLASTYYKDLWYSEDNGVTWTEESSNIISSLTYIIGLQSFFIYNNKIHVAAENEIWRRESAGNWTQIATNVLATGTTANSFTQVQVINNVIYICGDLENNNVVSYSGDSITWVDDIITQPAGIGAFINLKNVLYYIGGYNGSVNVNTVMQINTKFQAYNNFKNGLLVGLSTDAFSSSQTDLISEIENGTGTNELSYGETDNLTNSEPEVILNKCSMNLTRTFTNNSDNSVAIGEIGIKSSALWCRILPPELIGIKSGESKTISLEFVSEV